MKRETNLIQCTSCEYEGVGKSDSSAMFMVLLAMFVVSLAFIPMIIVALFYLGWILTKPVKYKCPECKSKHVKVLTISQQILVEEKAKETESNENQEQAN